MSDSHLGLEMGWNEIEGAGGGWRGLDLVLWKGRIERER